MNDFSNEGVNQRRLIIFAMVAVLVLLGFFMYKGWDKVVNNGIDRAVVITGSFSCLPPKPEAPEQRGCVLGVKSRDGSFYALDISRIQDANTDLKAEDTIAVTGTLKPESAITSSDWSEYDIRAIIMVNTLLRTR